jgi:hypothetical protein
VHIRDAADAVSLLALADSDALSQGVIDLAGRRAWSTEAVLHEMEMLWNRYTNALGLTHSVESLSNITSPVVHQFSGMIERPDLAPLHETLKSIGIEEGWRPLTAMRVSLMELFAYSIYSISEWAKSSIKLTLMAVSGRHPSSIPIDFRVS